MIEIDFPGGRKVRIRPFERYNVGMDTNTMRISCTYNGHEYYCVAPVEAGKSRREAQEKARVALERAIRAEKWGEVPLDEPLPERIARGKGDRK